jgi:chromosomal replication initiator protein
MKNKNMSPEMYAGLLKEDRDRAFRSYRMGISSCNVDKIIDVVALHFDVNVEDLLGSCRKRHLADPRHMAQHLASKHTEKSLKYIGDKFVSVKNSHCNIIHANKKCNQLYVYDPSFREHIDELEDKILVALK